MKTISATRASPGALLAPPDSNKRVPSWLKVVLLHAQLPPSEEPRIIHAWIGPQALVGLPRLISN